MRAYNAKNIKSNYSRACKGILEFGDKISLRKIKKLLNILNFPFHAYFYLKLNLLNLGLKANETSWQNNVTERLIVHCDDFTGFLFYNQ